MSSCAALRSVLRRSGWINNHERVGAGTCQAEPGGVCIAKCPRSALPARLGGASDRERCNGRSVVWPFLVVSSPPKRSSSIFTYTTEDGRERKVNVIHAVTNPRIRVAGRLKEDRTFVIRLVESALPKALVSQ
jgi:hypothetical protein